MHIDEIFYGVFWVSAILTIWFYTDWFAYYTQLFNCASDIRLLYQAYKLENPDAFFSDFLYAKALATNNRFSKFVLKLISCPLCSGVWLSLIFCFCFSDLLNFAPVYVGSLFVILQIKKML